MAGKEGKEGKESKAPEAAAPAADGAPKKKGLIKSIAVALAVVVLEVATVGVTMMMSGGPKMAVAKPPETAPKETVEKDAEVKIIEEQLPNSKEGHLYLYHLQVVAKVSEKNKEKVKELFLERDAEIKDHVRTIIASSELAALKEPGLETLRRQIAYQLEHDVGKDLIKELLIPKCTPMRMDN